MHLLDTMGRPWQNCDPQRNSQDTAHPGRRPITDNIDTLASFQLRHAGFVKKKPLGLYILTEKALFTVCIREGLKAGTCRTWQVPAAILGELF